eukprot:TRINITY_DN48951_c0_g1_i1.p3 TRINITY_DN48951_c0_g1~~TRINITY_DN48951_c0_g1_i1.p3  ORF type:complete len:176 (+),score=63.04 TRINITY_DN48951_c0_g1_i1:69-596(+)
MAAVAAPLSSSTSALRSATCCCALRPRRLPLFFLAVLLAVLQRCADAQSPFGFEQPLDFSRRRREPVATPSAASEGKLARSSIGAQMDRFVASVLADSRENEQAWLQLGSDADRLLSRLSLLELPQPPLAAAASASAAAAAADARAGKPMQSSAAEAAASAEEQLAEQASEEEEA